MLRTHCVILGRISNNRLDCLRQCPIRSAFRNDEDLFRVSATAASTCSWFRFDRDSIRVDMKVYWIVMILWSGPWENYLYVCMVLGGLISVGQICFSTGHLEAFLPGCSLSDGYTPDRKCIPGSYRIVVALLLEHLVLITQALVMSMINRQPKWIATRLYKIQRLKHKFFRDLKLSLSSVLENTELQ